MHPLAFVVAALAPPILAAIGGRCSGDWGPNCICLDKDACINKWGGTAYSGKAGNWPCPNDANNIWGCKINKCKGDHTVCQWRDFCEQGTIGYSLPCKRTPPDPGGTLNPSHGARRVNRKAYVGLTSVGTLSRPHLSRR